MKKILEIQNVYLNYQTFDDEISAINNISFTVKEGEFVSIIGPSGCGKTSILSIISGLIKPTKGKVEFKKECETGYMLQKDQLFPWLTVLDNVLLPLKIKKTFDKDKILYAKSLLIKYGLGEFQNKFPSQLSGGMRQRVALIRTLVFNPSLLLLDEPFSALDFQTRIKLCDDIYRIIKNENKTAILVTHDISEAISMSDVIYVLSDRPSCIKKTIYPNLEENTPLERRNNKNFSVLFNEIWKELNE